MALREFAGLPKSEYLDQQLSIETAGTVNPLSVVFSRASLWIFLE